MNKIKVDERYFSFVWKAKMGKRKRSGKYESDYESQTAKEMQKTLEKGYAMELVLEQL